MNPDSGRIHPIEDLEGVERIARGEPAESVEAALARAARRASDERERSTEPPPGSEIPRDWPRFRIGDRIGPIKGWWFQLVYADVEAQKLVIQPLEPTRSTATRRTGKPRRRRNRGKVGGRKR